MGVKFYLFSLFFAAAAWSSPSLPAAKECWEFHDGETTTLSLTYLGATAGNVALRAGRGGPAPGAKPAAARWELSAEARTDLVFSLFYRLENRYASTVNARTLLPESFVATLDESQQTGTTRQLFRQEAHRVQFVDDRLHRKKGAQKKTFEKEIPPGTHDVVSALFHLRAQRLQSAGVVDIPVFIGEELCHLKFTVEGEEELPTKIGKLRAWVLKVSVLKDGAEKSIPDTSVWLGKDAPHPLLKIKAKIKIGSLIAYLKSYEPGTNSGPSCLGKK